MTTRPEEEIGEVFSSVLSYYSSQLTSHGGMIVGFIVAFLALIQLKTLVSPTFFQFGATSLMSIEAYLLLRVVLYAGLSSVLLNSEQSKFDNFKPDLLPTARVNRFASEQLRKMTFVRRVVMISWAYRDSKNVREPMSYWVQPPMIVSAGLGILIDGVMFGAIDWIAYALASLSVLVLVSLPIFLGWLCWRIVWLVRLRRR